jgi:hypothetical protein
VGEYREGVVDATDLYFVVIMGRETGSDWGGGGAGDESSSLYAWA